MISKELASELIYNSFKNSKTITLTIIEPDLTCIYNASNFPKNAWYFHVHDTGILRIGEGRMIGVNKETGEIFYDGSDGGE